MGIMHLLSCKKLIISVVIVIGAIIYRNELNRYFNSLSLSNVSKNKSGVYSQDKLAQFNGITKKNLYVAVLGKVFDVTEGKRHYQKGAGYHYFVGKDGSRALVTGKFDDETSEKDHVMDLSCNELFTLLHWRNTFKQKYIEVGVLTGRFYDENGIETVYARELINKIKQCEIEKENTRKEDLKYPPCNIAWSEAEGTKVWCTTTSGGVKRSWTGVPRQLYSPGVEKPRCICLNTEEKNTISGLIKEYDNCPPQATTCLVNS